MTPLAVYPESALDEAVAAAKVVAADLGPGWMGFVQPHADADGGVAGYTRAVECVALRSSREHGIPQVCCREGLNGYWCVHPPYRGLDHSFGATPREALCAWLPALLGCTTARARERREATELLAMVLPAFADFSLAADLAAARARVDALSTLHIAECACYEVAKRVAATAPDAAVARRRADEARVALLTLEGAYERQPTTAIENLHARVAAARDEADARAQMAARRAAPCPTPRPVVTCSACGEEAPEDDGYDGARCLTIDYDDLHRSRRCSGTYALLPPRAEHVGNPCEGCGAEILKAPPHLCFSFDALVALDAEVRKLEASASRGTP